MNKQYNFYYVPEDVPADEGQHSPRPSNAHQKEESQLDRVTLKDTTPQGSQRLPL